MHDLSLHSQQTLLLTIGASPCDPDVRHFCSAYGIPQISYLDQHAFAAKRCKVAELGADRSQVVICGGPVETDLTQIALNLLVDGYQIFILVDRVYSTPNSSTRPALERLYQNGVSPLLWIQLQHEVRQSSLRGGSA